jgi:hypothetical protein
MFYGGQNDDGVIREITPQIPTCRLQSSKTDHLICILGMSGHLKEQTKCKYHAEYDIQFVDCHCSPPPSWNNAQTRVDWCLHTLLVKHLTGQNYVGGWREIKLTPQMS